MNLTKILFFALLVAVSMTLKAASHMNVREKAYDKDSIKCFFRYCSAKTEDGFRCMLGEDVHGEGNEFRVCKSKDDCVNTDVCVA